MIPANQFYSRKALIEDSLTAIIYVLKNFMNERVFSMKNSIKKWASANKPGLNERIAAFICGVLLSVILLITSTQALCYWIPGWWRSEYAKYNTPQYVTGEMSLDDAVYITEQMLDYCLGRIDTLDDTKATIDGVIAPFFTEREKLHLADCRNIFLGAVKFRIISIIVIIGLLIAIWFSVRKRYDKLFEVTDSGDSGIDNGSIIDSSSIIDNGSIIDSGNSGRSMQEAPAMPSIKLAFAKVLASGYLKALLALFLFAAFLIVLGMQDFTYLFTKFHHVFFDNDLWILDPRQDNLVNVMQEPVFADAAITIGSIWGCISLVLAALSVFIIRKK